jgi:hypothetical protein
LGELQRLLNESRRSGRRTRAATCVRVKATMRSFRSAAIAVDKSMSKL